ncbi:XdhC family protein [Rhodococcus triatomae]|uniref:Xanthine dehydrogenase accessory factor n=1 Tax=Rhodococcus triatomae TaxID=300028 RepID=A0A1G8BCK3_9NOCA|nr:XdhC/CoxI family protein [Rhodococcus triatomae]QNG17484.1 XdhC family protein [Rhodococcus triatomae]QNG22848.1 XdhC family protein [Rhodococcus triatomae]SDH30320.1 xanthine dehydrogenase accessory factor [Rhodococcus triatomae]
MDTVLEAIHRQWKSRRPVAIATVLAVTGSAPRDPGAMMAVQADGTVVGSISGGCVEGAIFDTAQNVLDTGEPRIEDYGPDGDLIAPGLTCGGSVRVLVERIDTESMPDFGRVADRVRGDLPVRWETVLDERGPARHRVVDALGDRPRTGLTAEGIFVRSFDARPPMVIVGSTDFAAELARVGARLGYRVTVCDSRPVFTTPERFPDADDVVCRWPSDWIAAERDAGRLGPTAVIVVLTHDPKVDVPVLAECLDERRWAEPPAYVGAMGSRTADDSRRRDLLREGITRAQLESLHSPVGLRIGNRGPAETAISIAAEIVQGTRSAVTGH